jgi:hypothetical protein
MKASPCFLWTPAMTWNSRNEKPSDGCGGSSGFSYSAIMVSPSDITFSIHSANGRFLDSQVL